MRRRKRRQSALPEPAAALPDEGAVIGYARVSTEDQSVDMQIAALQRAGCHRIFHEKISGVRAKRPQLDTALGMLRRGDVFVVWKLDRLGRSVLDLLRKVEHIEGVGATLRVLTQGIDTSNAVGRLMLQLLSAMAEFERALTQERTMAGVARRKARGLPVGRQPVMSEAEMAEAQRLRDAGWSVRDLADKFGRAPNTINRWTVDPETKNQAKRKS